MAVKGKGVDRVYELIDVGFSLEFLIGSLLKFMPDDDIVEMLEDPVFLLHWNMFGGSHQPSSPTKDSS